MLYHDSHGRGKSFSGAIYLQKAKSVDVLYHDVPSFITYLYVNGI